jgi:hypothetical protein
MTEEEARELEQANADLKEQVAQKDRRIEELEACLIGALLRIEDWKDDKGKIVTTVANPLPVTAWGASHAPNGKRVAKHLVGKKVIRGNPFCKC